MQKNNSNEGTNIVMNEVKLLLAEKRTSLAAMRTGIAVFVLPLSVLSVLIATSRLYNVFHVLHWLIPLMLICGALVLLGGYLVVRSILKMHRYDQLIQKIKREHINLAEFIE
jgi:uncharacterized membrane protein YkgB